MYGSVQATFQHGIMAPFRRPQRDPPPLELHQQQRHLEEVEFRHRPGGDAPQPPNDRRLCRNEVHQRLPKRTKKEPAKKVVETLSTADERYTQQQEEEQNLSTGSDSENQPETQEELVEIGASGDAANSILSKSKPTKSNSSQSESKPLKANENDSKDERRRAPTSRSAELNLKQVRSSNQIKFIKPVLYLL